MMAMYGLRFEVLRNVVMKIVTTTIIFVSILTFYCGTSSANHDREIKRVLILYSYSVSVGNLFTEKGILNSFEANKHFNIKVYTETLPDSTFDTANDIRDVALYLRHKYSRIRPDAIITVLPAALDFIMSQPDTLFPDIPIVAAQLDDAHLKMVYYSPLRHRITGTVFEPAISRLIDSVINVKPMTKHVALIAGTSIHSKTLANTCRNAIARHSDKLDIIDLTGFSMEIILKKTASLPPDTIILFTTLLKDGANRMYIPRDALHLISENSSAPIFGIYESYLNYGIVGGQLISSEKHGKEAASMVLQIMNGKSPASIPFGGQNSIAHAYDMTQLNRWGIPVSALPAGAELKNRPCSTWEEHKIMITGGASIIILEACLIIGLIVNIRRRFQAERRAKKNEERMKLAALSAGAGLFSIDFVTRQVWVTPRVRELLALPPDIVLNPDNLLNAVYADDLQLVRQFLSQAIQLGGEMVLEFRTIYKNEVRWISCRCRLQESHYKKNIMGTLIDVTHKKRTEETLRQREKELVVLTERVVSNKEEELKIIARDLHDDLSQRIAVLAIDMSLLELQMSGSEHAQSIGKIKDSLVEISENVHDLSRQLHPSILDDLGLIDAIKSECDTFFARTGIDIKFTYNQFAVELSGSVELCLYRMLQEGLRNIAKHSQSKEGRIRLFGIDEGIVLLIEDFGVGFDTENVKAKPGIGITSIKERAWLMNGKVSITSQAGQGTALEIFLPIGASNGTTSNINS